MKSKGKPETLQTAKASSRTCDIKREDLKYGVFHPITVDGSPRTCGWVIPVPGGWECGDRVKFSYDIGGEWIEVKVVGIGDPPEYRLDLKTI